MENKNRNNKFHYNYLFMDERYFKCIDLVNYKEEIERFLDFNLGRPDADLVRIKKIVYSSLNVEKQRDERTILLIKALHSLRRAYERRRELIKLSNLSLTFNIPIKDREVLYRIVKNYFNILAFHHLFVLLKINKIKSEEALTLIEGLRNDFMKVAYLRYGGRKEEEIEKILKEIDNDLISLFKRFYKLEYSPYIKQ